MGSYRVSRLALLALALAALGGCARDVTSPGATTAPRFSAAGGASNHLVLFKGNSIPADFGARVQALGGTVTYSHAGVGIAVVAGLGDLAAATLADGKDIIDVAPDAVIALDDPVAAAEATVEDRAASQANPAGASRYAWQWNMRAVHADQAWAAGELGDAGVTVAILDTGIDYDAPDLNGLVDLARSVSFVAPDDTIRGTYFPTRNDISDFHGHGTNVATQVSSKAAALAGVTSKTTLMGVKVLGQNGHSTAGSVFAGILWAADHGADVANMSLGGGFWKMGSGRTVAYINRIFDYAKRRGMLIVVAAGNDAINMDRDGPLYVTYCAAPHVVCVAATGPQTWAEAATAAVDATSFFTNFGRSAISVAGPGGNYTPPDGVVTAWPWGNGIASWVWSYCSKTRIAGFQANGTPILTSCVAGNRITGYVGTSQATPHVAGLAAQLVAQLGHGNPAQIKAAILKSADDLGQPGVDPFYGAGRINVAKALGL